MAEAGRQRSAPLSARVDGNILHVLTEGPARLQALVDLIDGARNSLRLVYYIFKDDESGRRIREALLAACGRGVRVWILIDGFGSEDVPDSFFKPLVDSRCHFCRFEPRWGRRYLLRNHQKLAIADGRCVLTGGFNIANDYFGTIEEKAWRDLGLRIEGPGVASLVDYFDDLYAWARLKHGRFRGLRHILERHSQNEGKLRWLFGGPVARLSPWTRAVRNELTTARSIDMIAAYFAPNWAMLRRIGGIDKRGHARLITAAKSDNGATIGAARYTYWRLLRRGVQIFEYQPTKLHTKLIIFDNVVMIGSANFDMRSLYLNLEMMLRVDDPAFAAMMRRFVDGEIANSKRILPEEHRKSMTLWNRLKWALGYFVVATADYNVSRRLNFGKRRFGGD